MPTPLADGSVSYRLSNNAGAGAVLNSLNSNPLGSMSGENWEAPHNFRYAPARIYVINHSRSKKWKWVHIPVSHRKGAHEALLADNELLKTLGNEEMVYRAVREGREMTRYKEGVRAVNYRLDIPGARYEMVDVPGDNGFIYKMKQYAGKREVIIPPSHPDTPGELIMVEVPDGTWDYYLGNYDRMRGFPGVKPLREDGTRQERFDATVQNSERNALANRWSQPGLSKHNPVFRVTDNAVISGGRRIGATIIGASFEGETEERNNAHGFLEFVREPIMARNAEAIDRDYLQAIDLVEA